LSAYLDYSYSTIYVEGQSTTGTSHLPLAVPNEIVPTISHYGDSFRGRDFTERDNKDESRVAMSMKRLPGASFRGGTQLAAL